jgi:hypothetical protein
MSLTAASSSAPNDSKCELVSCRDSSDVNHQEWLALATKGQRGLRQTVQSGCKVSLLH